MLGAYLHIPFCSAICNYCNFNRGLFDAALKTRYVAALESEIRRAAEPATPADSIYFGGGTPSLLSGSEIGRLISALRDSFAIADHAEVTLEANPETVTVDSLIDFRSAGINRISFGVQSFREAELRRLGRLHSAERARQAFRDARTAGFDNISLDLMMWLPEQTVDEWLSSVDELIAIGPDHASMYLLELYPNAPLREEMARGGWSQAPDEDAETMYLEALARFDAAGYEHYEISNVARPGKRAVHNVKYWQDGEWLAFGCGAHGTRAGERWRNVPATMEYVLRIERGDSAVIERLALSGNERLEDALFTGLRLSEGLDLKAIAMRYGVDVWARYGPDLARFVDVGLLVHEPGDSAAGGRLRLTRSGMLLANEVMAVFIGPPSGVPDAGPLRVGVSLR